MFKPSNRLWVSSLLVSGLIFLTSCAKPAATARRLPHLGEPEVLASGDTLWAAVPTFRLHDQDNAVLRPASFAGRVYVADFFFTTCPTICPGMQRQMLRVYSRYQSDPRIAFLSHTIDPAHDSVPVLRAYAHRLGVANARQWHFATAPHDTIFALADAYQTVAGYDQPRHGNLIHSGTLTLVDQRGRVLDTYDGLNPQAVNRLLQRLDELLP
ncbi:MAG: SCO family protein [Janthinobacterium lividum]